MGANNQGQQYEGGSISIELPQDNTRFISGQNIRGEVVVQIHESIFPVTDIQLVLYGNEIVRACSKIERSASHFIGPNHCSEQRYGATYTIIQLQETLQEFPEDQQPQQGYELRIPFILEIPDWLPSSFWMIGDKNHLKMGYRYCIHVQFTPAHDFNYLD